MNICKNCGCKNSVHDRFCRNCGSVIQTEKIYRPSGKKNAWILVMPVVTAVLVVAIAVAAYVIIRNDSSKGDSVDKAAARKDRKAGQEEKIDSTEEDFPTEKAADESEIKEEETGIFASMPSHFAFSSGAGGWGTVIELSADGTFTGSYSDSDMGDMGEGYPGGTVYICDFKGKFSEPKKMDDYTWSMELEWLETESKSGEIYFEDDIKYVCSDPYGLEDADTLMIYLPGSPVEFLPEEFKSWAHLNPEDQTLPYYGIYNVKGQKGFVSYD